MCFSQCTVLGSRKCWYDLLRRIKMWFMAMVKERRVVGSSISFEWPGERFFVHKCFRQTGKESHRERIDHRVANNKQSAFNGDGVHFPFLIAVDSPWWNLTRLRRQAAGKLLTCSKLHHFWHDLMCFLAPGYQPRKSTSQSTEASAKKIDLELANRNRSLHQ